MKPDPVLLEKIKIFLTDQTKDRRANVSTMSKEVMLAVNEFYPRPDNADNFRKEYGLTSKHVTGWDSGGFQFLMGKLKGIPVELLPCGIEVPVNAQPTLDLYRRVGVTKSDLPIQLDLPPRYDLPPDHKRELIERSAAYYWEMVEEMPWIVPVVHGWKLEEILYSLELVEDPDKLSQMSIVGKIRELAVGTNAGAKTDWQMGKLNPNRKRYDDDIAAGVFAAPGKGSSAVDHCHPTRPRHVAVGSFKAETGSVNYLPYTDNQANRNRVLSTPVPTVIDAGIVHPDKSAVVSCAKRSKKRIIASPTPGGLDTRGGKPIVNKFTSNKRKRIVATPTPGMVDAGMQKPDDMPMVAAPRRIAVGSFAATTMSNMPRQKRKKRKQVPYMVIINRIAMVLNLLREDYRVFMLGGASPHMQHMLFMSGAEWTDTSAWRIKGMMAEIYLPEHSSGENAFKIGHSKKKPQMDDEAVEILREVLSHPEHPYSGMSAKRFLAIGHMYMSEWYDTWPTEKWEARPDKVRMDHNAFILKFYEEQIARDFATDPVRYHKYLMKRYGQRKYIPGRIDALWKKLKRPYVQTEMNIFCKEPTE